jgi:hypothetical protein
MNNSPITISGEGFLIGESSISWGEIRKIVASKLDLISVDEIRFASRTIGDQTEEWVEISEEQPGFDELIGELESQFPAISGWRELLVKPAFAENRTQLFVTTD